MMELIYTSSSKGVDRGSQGYCTVACSDSIPALLKINLENMSDYSWIYPPHDKDFNKNPVNYSFVKVKAGDEWLRVILRIGLNGLDYSGRPNKIAHFICLKDDDLDECHELSPAHIISRQDTFVDSWADDSTFSEKDLSNLGSEMPSPSTTYWQEVTGDGAWANHLVQEYQDSTDSQINVIYDSHVDPLKLIVEATSLLSSEEQWDTTFSTYFNGTSLNSSCNWRFILRGSKNHEGLKPNKNIIDLNDLQGKAPEAELSMDDLSIEDSSSGVSTSQNRPTVSRGQDSNQRRATKSNKSGGQKISILLLVVVIVALTAMLLNKDLLFGGKSDNASDVQEETLYNYTVDKKPIPTSHELEEYGDVLIIIKTDEFLTALQTHKKLLLDVFDTHPPKIETNLVSTKQYKVIDNVISKLFLEKVDGEFIQNREALIKLRLSKGLVVESLSEIDQAFIDEFKENIKKMKINRIIFEFI